MQYCSLSGVYVRNQSVLDFRLYDCFSICDYRYIKPSPRALFNFSFFTQPVTNLTIMKGATGVFVLFLVSTTLAVEANDKVDALVTKVVNHLKANHTTFRDLRQTQKTPNLTTCIHFWTKKHEGSSSCCPWLAIVIWTILIVSLHRKVLLNIHVLNFSESAFCSSSDCQRRCEGIVMFRVFTWIIDIPVWFLLKCPSSVT